MWKTKTANVSQPNLHTFRLPPELFAELTRLAKREERSVTGEVITLLREALALHRRRESRANGKAELYPDEPHDGALPTLQQSR